MRSFQITVLLFLSVSISSFSQDVEAVFNEAEGQFASGKYQEAQKLYTEVIAADSENMNVYLRRGFCRSVLKDYDKAIEDFSVVVSKHPEHPFAYISRGGAYNKTEQWNSAIADFDKALTLDPENQEAYNNRGWAKVGLGMFKEACMDWKTSRKLGNEEAKLILKNNNCK